MPDYNKMISGRQAADAAKSRLSVIMSRVYNCNDILVQQDLEMGTDVVIQHYSGIAGHVHVNKI